MLKVNIRDFGAECNDSLQTEKIQGAIDYCFRQGGGQVIVPAGDFLVGSIRLRSNVSIHLEENAHIIGSRNPDDYMGILSDSINPLKEDDLTEVLWLPVDLRKNFHHMNKAGSRWNNAIIRAIDAENISITGEKGSYIDGCDCFDKLGEEKYRGPHAINFHRCKNIKFSGYEIRNSANWAHALFDCENVDFDNITVIAGHDGIHITSCTNVSVINSDFYTGDDCVAGIDNLDVKVKNCKMNTACSAFRFGGTRVYISNCEMFGPAKYLFRGSLTDEEKRDGKSPDGNHRYNMLSAYTYYSDFSREIKNIPGDIVIENCSIKNTDRFIHYNFSGNEPWQKNKPLSDITFKNIKAVGIKNPLTLYGGEDEPVSFSILDSNISFKDALGSFMNVCHYKRILIKNVEVLNICASPLIKKWSDKGEIILENFIFDSINSETEGMAEEDFICTAI